MRLLVELTFPSSSWCSVAKVVSTSFVTPWTVAHLSMGFPRQEYWSELPFPSPGDLPDPRIKPTSPAGQADSLPLSHWATEPLREQAEKVGKFLPPDWGLSPPSQVTNESRQGSSTLMMAWVGGHHDVCGWTSNSEHHKFFSASLVICTFIEQCKKTERMLCSLGVYTD